MRYVQAPIEDEDFIKLKFFCSMTQMTIGMVLSRLIHDFVSSPKFENVEKYKREIFDIGNAALTKLIT